LDDIGEDRRAQLRRARIDMLRNVLEDLLRVEPEGDDVFRGATSAVFDRVYGGQTLAQGLMAAAATIADGRQPNSTHCYFLRIGDPKKPLTFKVERVRDARNFSNRVVRVEQGGVVISMLMFSFAHAGGGFEHQWKMPDAMAPETLPSRDESLVALYGETLPMNAGVPWPIDIRHVNRRPWDSEPGDGRNLLWLRADMPLPDDPLLHTALLLYASDFAMPEAVIARHPIHWEDLMVGRGVFGASLDHSFWLHTPVRFDDWLLHEQESSRGAGGRGYTTGRFFNRQGELVASVAQEIFIKETGSVGG